MRGQGRAFVRGGIWWIAYYAPDPKNLSRKKEFRETTGIPVEDQNKIPKAVINELKKRHGEIQSNKFVPPSTKFSFDNLVELIERDYKLNGYNLENLKNHLKHPRKFFGPIKPIDYTPWLGSKYQEKRLGEGASVATINREISKINRMLELAVGGNNLPPMKKIKLLDGENVRQGFINPQDIYKLIPHLAPYLQHFVEFLFLTCWRKGRVSGIRKEQVYITAPIPYIDPGPGRGQKETGAMLPLVGPKGESTRLLEIVRAQIELANPDCPYLFHRNGKKIKSFRKEWYRSCIESGLGKMELQPDGKTYKYVGLIPHDLRRSGAMHLERAGVPRSVIMKRAGWKTENTFSRYRIVPSEDLQQSTVDYERYINSKRDSE